MWFYNQFQSVERDFAFVVHDHVKADDLLKAIKATAKKLISDVMVFDIYKGKEIEADHKSMAVRVALQPVDKTLTDEEIERVSKTIIDTIAQKFKATLRV